MTDLDPTGGQTLLDQFTTTYLRYRWLIGAGIVAVTIPVVLLGAARPYIWVVTAAGLFILAHSLAIGAWRFNGPLSELEAARPQTIGVVSHELRNHMTGVIGVTELVIDPDLELDPRELRELLKLVHRQAVEASDVIEDLLTASRAERGVLDVVTERVDLCHEAEVVLRRFGVEDREIPLESPDGAVWAEADPHRFRQVLRNLITNAVRYGGPNVAVSVVGVGPSARWSSRTTVKGCIRPTRPRSFSPIGDRETRRRLPGQPGSGCGSHGTWPAQMGGDLTYQRQSGETIFEVTLPGCPPSAAGRGSELAGARPAGD